MLVIPNWLLTLFAAFILFVGAAVLVVIACNALIGVWNKLLTAHKEARVLFWVTAHALNGEEANRRLFWLALYSQAEKSDAHALEIAEQALAQRGMGSRKDWEDLRGLLHHHRWGDNIPMAAYDDDAQAAEAGTSPAEPHTSR